MNRRKRQSQPPPLPQQQLLQDPAATSSTQRYARYVQLLIERYLPMYMDKFQIVHTLSVEHEINPSFSLMGKKKAIPLSTLLLCFLHFLKLSTHVCIFFVCV